MQGKSFDDDGQIILKINNSHSNALAYVTRRLIG